MAGAPRTGRRRGPTVGSIATGMVVGEAKRGVVIELGGQELVLARSRFGAAADRIEGASYGDALTVEVVAAPDQAAGIALTRIGIERSVRQPREMVAALERRGKGFELRPADGSPPFAVVVLDRLDPDALIGAARRWSVGATHRDVRLVEPSAGHLA